MQYGIYMLCRGLDEDEDENENGIEDEDKDEEIEGKCSGTTGTAGRGY